MNYITYKQIWDNARLFGSWLVLIAGALTSQMFNQVANTQMVHLKVIE